MSSDDNDWPVFPIGPILESYGGDYVSEGYDWRPYRCPFPRGQKRFRFCQ